MIYSGGKNMRTEKNILIAFLLNLFFSILEFIGGAITNSVAIMSDAIHDMGDAMSIGLSYVLEKKSKQKSDNKYTYGYIRFSVLGSLITTVILVLGSIFVIYNAVKRICNPIEINYNGMIIFAIIGVIINFIATYCTREGNSLNQKSVNLHLLEDVLGWLIVLIGAIVMKFTDIKLIDSIMSIGVAIFILVNALKSLKEITNLFLEKIPKNVDIEEIKEHLLKIDGVKDVHHIHVRSIDGYTNYATMHIVVTGDYKQIKHKVKEELKEHGIEHTTIELEEDGEKCNDEKCEVNKLNDSSKHHHHHLK